MICVTTVRVGNFLSRGLGEGTNSEMLKLAYYDHDMGVIREDTLALARQGREIHISRLWNSVGLICGVCHKDSHSNSVQLVTRI